MDIFPFHNLKFSIFPPDTDWLTVKGTGVSRFLVFLSVFSLPSPDVHPSVPVSSYSLQRCRGRGGWRVCRVSCACRGEKSGHAWAAGPRARAGSSCSQQGRRRKRKPRHVGQLGCITEARQKAKRRRRSWGNFGVRIVCVITCISTS